MDEQQHGPSAHAWAAFLTEQCGRAPVDGTVVDVVPFGAFVDLGEGVHGLMHVSEWAGTRPEPGATVSVRILALDLDRRRVSLRPA